RGSRIEGARIVDLRSSNLDPRAASRAGPAGGGDSLDELLRLGRILRSRLDVVQEPFAPEVRGRLVEAARRDGASVREWRELDALLATPLVAGAGRVALWQAARDLEARLVE